jgi:hypothetical protein
MPDPGQIKTQLLTMPITALLQHLLANRYKLSDGAIADCLDLAIIAQQHRGQRLPWELLARRWGCMNQPYLSKRMRRLANAGLLDYDCGVSGEPGYLIHRVGPAA